MKSKVKGNDITVQGTNDSSIVSKCSMAAAGYFEDTFLKNFVVKNSRRSPLINRGYYVRAKAMDYAIRLFLQTYKTKKKQIISLGAGFDSTYFRLKDKGLLSSTMFLELDFPDVVRRKTNLIYATKDLSNLVGATKNHDCKDFENGITASDYSLVGCDLTDLARLDKALTTFQFCKESPTLLFSEVVLTYVNNEYCSKLIRWAADTFPNAVFLLYEQIHPDDAFGVIMKKHFTTLQSPLKCIDLFPNLSSQISRFRALGWHNSEAMDMNEFYYNYTSEEERDRINRIEPFDEFEEWHLKCSHYALVGAFSQSCSDLKEQIFRVGKEGNTGELLAEDVLRWNFTMEEDEAFQRFGHQLVQVTNSKIILSCGFGSLDNKHQRLRNGAVIDIIKDGDANCTVQTFPMFERSKLFHTIVQLSNGSFFVFGGRESPLKPCLDYGIFTMDEDSLETNRNSPTDPVKEISNFIWKGALSMQPSETERQRNEPCPRWRHTATRVIIEDKEFVLVFGGRNQQCLALSDCWLFDTAENSWTEVPLQTDLGVVQPRHSHSACLWGENRIIISGGLCRDSQPINTLEILHLKSDGCYIETVSVVGHLPARYSHNSHVCKEELWVIGGVNLRISPEILVINLQTFQWKEFKLQGEEGNSYSKPLMLHNHASFIRGGKEILIFGGGGNCFSFGTHFNSGIITVDLPRHNHHHQDLTPS